MKQIFISLCIFLIFENVFAQNPIIRNQFSADPSARVFNGRVYVFPSHDIPVPPNKNLRNDWFCMEDYHVFSSENLIDWTDHGVIVSQYQVPWVDTTTYSMWAPDCIEKNGKYYFYFPTISNIVDSNGRKRFSIGVAIADKPEGPYIPQPKPIEGVVGIDPNVFIDKDGQAYLYWSLGKIFVAKLKDNMLELDSEPQVIKNLPEKGLIEGPWVFERKGIYYLTFPHVENKTERLEYAIGNHPLGPFKMAGVIMDESSTGCWTNHHSIIEFNGQWYLFYHHNDYSPHFDKNRSVRIDSLFFNEDGTIRKVIPTLRGAGITPAIKEINIDRYSKVSDKGVSITFIDTLNKFKGWKTIFNEKDAWIQYNAVDFEKGKFDEVFFSVYAENGGSLEIRLDHFNGKKIAEINILPTNEWRIIKSKVSKIESGIHNIVVVSTANSPIEVDWIKFHKK
ncbi:family 43 glycosylhydrolase [Melioribacter sp. OK-6-Me]|uniref:family 43 glycosylhydrolase n=1 Tax=unclassified Melioribacter TaxID=2627329 RepID=UPI003ED8E193